MISGNDNTLVHNSMSEKALFGAIEANRFDEFKRLINGENFNSKNEYGWTPLHYICRFGRRDMYDYVMSTFGNSGILLNEQDRDGYTPLMGAVSEDHKEIIQDLILRGADINIQDNKDVTPLMWACSNGQKEIVEEFIFRGADISRKDKWGRTAFDWVKKEDMKQMYTAAVETRWNQLSAVVDPSPADCDISSTVPTQGS